MGDVFLRLKLKKQTPNHFLAAHGVKIDFMVGYFTWNTDVFVLLAMALIACYIHFRLEKSNYFLVSPLFTKIISCT